MHELHQIIIVSATVFEASPWNRSPRFAFLLVHKQAAGIAVSGIAHFADVWLFSSVCKDMVFQVLVPDEGLAASVAMIVCFPRVSF